QTPKNRMIPYSRMDVRSVVWYRLLPAESSPCQPNKVSMYLLLPLFLGWVSSSTPNNPQRKMPVSAITISVLLPVKPGKRYIGPWLGLFRIHLRGKSETTHSFAH